ncbi:hypothetical protein LGQ02_10270 [Bacillus shivajii]|uniref:hypothetical protein n=1 Tax=Bacillus shivajii TaxID=1983719 RepID=UPI001CFAA4FD|nr:hypothetical protein [Bacillus shivajii]UCZ55077.1 hypothetical protein LGQ02_10270 [Bacillus shivajii]
MVFILMVILIIVSVGCSGDARTERNGLKLSFSIASAIMLSLVMEATAHGLEASGTLEGMYVTVIYFILPIITFSMFQLLLYDLTVHQLFWNESN